MERVVPALQLEAVLADKEYLLRRQKAAYVKTVRLAKQRRGCRGRSPLPVAFLSLAEPQQEEQ